ncbi:DNA (cytosine-5-)-methyltransferase [Propionibacterium freudenreichii]|uniref:DNA (cytosine-5-)-methyltransferase n=2 Tax=Propionibacterium freudenreichii TaxID=1744 RepID=UPI00243427F0|nr:DNA (cytosine-5-)-methyltransferase [Propionibacterium freudenreichii]
MRTIKGATAGGFVLPCDENRKKFPVFDPAAVRSELEALMSESAFEIYARSHTQAQVAKVANVTERTAGEWVRKGAPASIKLLFEARQTTHQESCDFTFIDLFAGIGGTRLGFEGAGGRCVFTSEWDKKAVATYTENFQETLDHSFADDIQAVDARDVPDHDVLVAGFPCQPFSIAGVSKKNSLGRPTGFEDKTQGTLFFDVARIIAEKQPRAFVLENVRNLQSHDKGRTFATIMETLRDELGYHVDYRVIGAEPWVPQKRHRIFIVGFREDPIEFNFDNIEIPKGRPSMASVLHPQDGTEKAEPPYTEGLQAWVSGKYTLSDRLWAYLQNYAAKHKAAGNGFGYGIVGPDDVARTLSARYYKDGSEILVRRGEGNPRRLTPRECARLMGFPKGFKIPVSDTAAYHQFGNSVVVPVVQSVAKLVCGELSAQENGRIRQTA